MCCLSFPTAKFVCFVLKESLRPLHPTPALSFLAISNFFQIYLLSWWKICISAKECLSKTLRLAFAVVSTTEPHCNNNCCVWSTDSFDAWSMRHCLGWFDQPAIHQCSNWKLFMEVKSQKYLCKQARARTRNRGRSLDALQRATRPSQSTDQQTIEKKNRTEKKANNEENRRRRWSATFDIKWIYDHRAVNIA